MTSEPALPGSRPREEVKVCLFCSIISTGWGLWLGLRCRLRLHFHLSINFLIKNSYNGQMPYVGK